MRKLTPWFTAWVVCAVLVFAARLMKEPAHDLKSVRLINRRGEPVRVLIYFPGNMARAPAAVVCQPINDPPEYARMLALELVREGFVVLAFDWRGQQPDENRQLLREQTQATLRADVGAAVAYLRSRREVDPARIVIAGHSVGGTLAIDAADNDLSIQAVAVIGMEADVLPAIPRNVLWAVGLYDEFRPLGHMREVFRSSAATRENERVTVGGFARGTARRLAVSPTADHFNELQDWGIQREVVNWFRGALGMGGETRLYWMETRGLLVMLGWFSALAGAMLTLRRFWQGRAGVLRLATAAALGGIWAASRLDGDRYLGATNAILMLFLFVLLAGFLARQEENSLAPAAQFVSRRVGAVWLSVLLTLMINSLPYYFEHAYYALMLPEFTVKYLLDLANAYLFDYGRPLFFSAYGPERLAPRWWIYAVGAAEIARPGVILSLVARALRWRARPAQPEGRPQPVLAWIVLVALAIFFVGILWLRLRQGFLTEESARTGLKFLVRFAVPPFFFFVLFRKLLGRRKEEEVQSSA